MARKVRIVVEPSEEHPDVLTVQDALLQARDFFDLLADESLPHVVWNLTLATTNSPFTCEGEAIDIRTRAGAEALVAPRIAAVEANLSRVEQGGDFDETFPRDKIETAKRVLRRTTNGIGATKFGFGQGRSEIAIPARVARNYFDNVEKPQQSLHSYLFARTSRREQGSIEGRIVEIATDYDLPALIIREHGTDREISCRINPAALEALSEELRARDVWDQKRVRVRGTLNFDQGGRVMRVLDGIVVPVEPNPIAVEDILDRDFKGRFSVTEYLDRLREDEFGG